MPQKINKYEKRKSLQQGGVSKNTKTQKRKSLQQGGVSGNTKIHKLYIYITFYTFI